MYKLMAAAVLLSMSWVPFASAERLKLVSAFDLGETDMWQRQRIEFRPGSWRVNSLDGEAATEAQLSAVLADLGSLTVGATCANVASSDVAVDFCGLQLSRVDFGTAAADRFTDPVEAHAGWLQLTTESAFDAEWSASEGDEGGFIGATNLSLDASPTTLTLNGPDRYLGNQLGVLGGDFRFSTYAVTAGASGLGFVLSSGLVSLSAAALPIPEPDESVLLMSGLLLIAARRVVRSVVTRGPSVCRD